MPTAFRAVEDFALKRGLKWSNNTSHEYYIRFNSYESARPGSFDEFLSALKQASRFESFRCRLPFLNSMDSEALTVSVEYLPSYIDVAIKGSGDDMVVACHEFIRGEWRLRNPPIHRPQEGRPRNLQATIFLGKHFDRESQEAASTLSRFLELLRFNVQEADEYRASPIPEKVQRLIQEQDIYLGIVTGHREHSWLTAEAAFAQGRNRHAIVVVEEGAVFNPTIQGRDYEHIAFPSGFIEKAFVKLLQEFRSLGISGL